MTSNSSGPAISGGRQLHDRIAAVVGAAMRPALEEAREQEAAEQLLALRAS